MEIKRIIGGYLDNNTYVVTDNGKAVIIDAAANIDMISKAVGHNEVCGVLITHGHYDHISGLRDIIDRYDVKCYMSERAIPKLTDNHLNCSDTNDMNVTCILQSSDIMTVKDGEKLDIFTLPIEVIETPGHSDCGLTFIIEGALFTGDTLFKGYVGRYDLPTSSRSALVTSLNRIFRLGGDHEVYPGHGDSTTLNNERRR